VEELLQNHQLPEEFLILEVQLAAAVQGLLILNYFTIAFQLFGPITPSGVPKALFAA
jgi:hypothetical protein